jgi:hypothetical protein
LWVSQRQLKQLTKIQKQYKKAPLQIKLPDLFLLKHLLIEAKNNSIEPKSAVMSDVV